MAKRKKQRQSKSKNITLHDRLEIIIAILALVGIGGIVGAYNFVKDEIFDGSFSPVRISSSECLPYWGIKSEGGYQDNLMYADMDVKEEGINKTFSIQTFFENPKKSPVRIESVRTEIVHIEPITEESLYIDMILDGYTIKIFAANNGWEEATNKTARITASIPNASTYSCYSCSGHSITLIADEVFCYQNFALKSGDVLEIAEYNINFDRFKEYSVKRNEHDNGWNGWYISDISLGCYIDENDKSIGYWYWLWYNMKTDEFMLEPSGISEEEDPPCSVTLYSILNIDSAVESLNLNNLPYIQYLTPGSTPQIEDTYRIATVIAPTKSCYIECRNVFTVDGKLLKTDVMKAKVIVPVYWDNYDLMYGLISDIGELGSVTSPQLIEQIKEHYRYKAGNFNNHDRNKS